MVAVQHQGQFRKGLQEKANVTSCIDLYKATQLRIFAIITILLPTKKDLTWATSGLFALIHNHTTPRRLCGQIKVSISTSSLDFSISTLVV